MPPLKALASRDLYAVGWIAALPLERAAATAILDERHEKPLDFDQPYSDTNSYTWGRIGEHNVVIASLAAGKYGTTSAAATALPMLTSFPQIRFGLLVGIGAGISRPDKGQDIRLGDVAVSQPRGNSGGVIQYDLFKAKPGNQRDGVAFLNSPPEVLLHALASIQAEHELEPPKLLKYLEEAMARYPRLAKQGYIYQGFENDQLFKTSDPNEEIQREPRDSTNPKIHYGIIASGNTLLKDATYRDKILEDIGDECICFEMEAAGLMNNFPCIVIRGISDYADSHKNDRWQRYAAATAAAYAKELLAFVPSQELQKTQKAIDALENIFENVAEIRYITNDTRAVVGSLRLDNQSDKIKKWLAAPDPSTNLNEAQKKHHEGTGSWFLESELFGQWKSGERQHLWLHGIPGCGKTVLSAAVIGHLNQQHGLSHAVLNFFFDFTDADKQSLDKLLRSLIAQLYSRCENTREELNKLFSSCEDGHRQPTYESLFTTFIQMANYVSKIQIVIDALDECKTRKDLLSWMEDLARSGHTGLHFLVTSRKEEDIESELKRWLHQGDIISIQQDPVNRDIQLYVYRRLQNDRGFERWRTAPAVQDEIKTELMEKANGMFRWAACQLDILQDCLDLRMLRKSLKSLPKTLEETYARILASISEDYRQYAIRILQFLTYSERPLTIQEAVDVIVVEPDGNPPFDPRQRLPEPREILKICSSLVSLVTRETLIELQLAHFSVQQYLKSKRIKEAFPRTMPEVGVIFQKEISEISARGSITRICLAYLLHLDKQQPISKTRQEFPLAQYSAQYWMNHARPAETKKDVQGSIMHFFLQQSQAYTVWLKLFNPDAPSNLYGRVPSPIYYASLAGLQYTVEMLSKRGADVNAQAGAYGNALQAASANGYKEIVQLLLEKGADVNRQGGQYGNALQAASTKGHKEIVQLLLEEGADANAQAEGYGNSLLAASTKGYKEISGWHANALQAASANGHKEIVRLLLERGANIPQGWRREARNS
ncbi:purine and uridine phosphorylase [Aspergillus falconensis]